MNKKLYGAVGGELPFIQETPIRDVENATRELLDDVVPFSEALLTIGSALLTWRTRPILGSPT